MEFINTENCLFLIIIQFLIDTFFNLLLNMIWSICRLSSLLLWYNVSTVYRGKEKKVSLSIQSRQLYMYVNDIQFFLSSHHIQIHPSFSCSIYIYLYWSFVVFARLADAFNFSFEMFSTARRLCWLTFLCSERTHRYDENNDGMGRMRVTHFSEIISDSVLLCFLT